MATRNYTIASSGADFATPALAAAAVNAGTLSGAIAGDDIVFTITQNTAFDSTFLVTANPTGYNSVTLTVGSGVRHNGTYGSGARLVISTAVTNAISRGVTSLSMTVEWLEVTVTGSGKISGGFSPGSFASGKTFALNGCMFHDNGAPNVSPFRVVAIGGTGTNNGAFTCPGTITNTLIANWKSASTVAATGIGLFTGGSGGVTVTNCTIDDVDVTGGTSGVVYGVYPHNNAASTYKNVVVTQIGTNTTTGTKACFNTGSSATASNNATSDGSAIGSSSLTSIVRGDNFNNPAAGDYRPLNDGAPIFGAGVDLVTTPTGVNFDLTGRDRDAQGDTWSIGAYQLSAGGSVTPAVGVNTPVTFGTTKAVGGAAALLFTGTYAAGPPTGIEYRLNNTGGWANLGATIGGGTWSGTAASVPAGTNVVSVRWANDTSVTASVSNVLVGTVYLGAGQSNESNRLTNQQAYAHATQKAAVIDQDDLSWRELTAAPTDPEASTGSYHALLATQHLADRNEPCGFITTANGGQTINQWFTTSSQASWTSAKARVTASGTTPTAVLIDIGESDALAATGYATYRARLLNWIADIKSTYPGVPVFIALTGTVGGGVVAADLDDIRKAQLSVIDESNGIYLSRCGHDRAGLHWTTDAEGLTQAARTYLPYQYALFGGSNGRGPRVASVRLNAARDQVTVAFDRSLKTGLTFATQPWAVSDNGTPATVSGVAYYATNGGVLLTLSAPLAGAAGTCVVTFSSGDTAAGLVIPKSADIAMPSGSAVQLPAEPFYTQSATEFSPTTGPGGMSGLSGLSGMAAI